MFSKLAPKQPATSVALAVSQDSAATEIAAATPEEGSALFYASAEPEEVLPAEAHRVASTSDEDIEHYSAVGMASWYGAQFHGKPTANGEIFNRLALTAAHPTLPLPSYVRITNLDNSRSITVRVNDRGPYSHNRLIDVSEQTAELLAFRRHGLTRVRVDYLAPAPVGVDDGQKLLATYRGPAKSPSAVAAAPPAQTVRVAFADEEENTGGRGGPIEKVSQHPSVLNRILMAFNVAGD